jgi:hypothetical protein
VSAVIATSKRSTSESSRMYLAFFHVWVVRNTPPLGEHVQLFVASDLPFLTLLVV